MNMNKKKARKLQGMVAMINKIAKDEAIEGTDINTYFSQCAYTVFECEITGHSDNFWNCCFSYQKMTTKADNMHGHKLILHTFQFCGHQPSTVYLYDDSCSYDEFNEVVTFIRAALKNGVDNMEYGEVKVVSKMTDYLDFTVS